MPRPKGSKNRFKGVSMQKKSVLDARRKAQAEKLKLYWAKRRLKEEEERKLAHAAKQIQESDDELDRLLPLLPPEQQTRLRLHKQFYHNPLLWGRYYFPIHFRCESPPFHLEMLQAALRFRYLVIASPRQSAKSTIITFLYVIHSVVFKKRHLIVLVQNTFEKAVKSLLTIKKELIENEHLKENYPAIKITKDTEGEVIIEHSDGFRSMIVAKGANQIGSLRGYKFGAYRPDLIIGDDMEDDELVRNPERRLDFQSLYDDALVPAGDRGICQYIIVGTVLHDDSQLAKLLNGQLYPEYATLFYQAHTNPFKGVENGEASLWPETWTIADLQKLAKDKPSVYAKEYQNDPVAGASARFKKEDFRYWRVEDSRYVLLDQSNQILGSGNLSDCRAAIACDLAWKEKRAADSTVILPGYITPNSEILIDDYINETGVRPNKLWDYLTTMEKRLKLITGAVVFIGFEEAMLEVVTNWVLREYMKKENYFLSTKKLIWDADKETRIETRLEPRYAQHVIFHKRGMGDLEAQLERFPSAAKDDIADAAQGLVQLLQFPKKLTQSTPPTDQFMKMRQLTIDAKRPRPVGLYSISRTPNHHLKVYQSPF